MNNIKICYTCDDNYAQFTGVSMASVLSNAAPDDSLHFYIISDGISNENKQKIYDLKSIKDFEITFITFDSSIFKEFESTKTTNYLPIASFYRLKISSLISNEDKIVYLDPDTIVKTSLAEFYNTDIEKYYCGGIPDIGTKRLTKKKKLQKNNFYINSGVLLINLKKWRNDNVEEIFIQCSKDPSKQISLGDQDIINMCFDGEIYKFESKWNVQVINYCSCSDYSGKYNILHYTGASKPWKFGSYIPQKKEYFKYLELTGWEHPSQEWKSKSFRKGLLLYFKHRPIFMFRPGFYKYLFGYIFNKNI